MHNYATFICSNDFLIRGLLNKLQIRPNYLLIRSNGSFMSSKDLLIGPNESWF